MASQTLILFSVLAAFVAFSAARPQEAYPTQYDNFDVDKVLTNRRLLENYFKCLVDRGPCTKEATELKLLSHHTIENECTDCPQIYTPPIKMVCSACELLPDALQSKCSKCNEKQKEKAEKVARYIIDKERDMWKEVKAKYDPDGKWEATYGQEAREHGFKV